MDKDFYEQQFVKNMTDELARLRQTVSNGFDGVYKRINDLDTKFDTKLTIHEKANVDDIGTIAKKQSFIDGRAAGIAGFVSVGVGVVMWLVGLLINNRN